MGQKGIEIADSLVLTEGCYLGKIQRSDEAAQKEPEYLKQRLSEAVGVYDFYLDSAFKRFRGKLQKRKRKLVRS
jgi:hypothetical protein